MTTSDITFMLLLGPRPALALGEQDESPTNREPEDRSADQNEPLQHAETVVSEKSIRGETQPGNLDARGIQPYLTHRLSRAVNAAMSLSVLEGAVELKAG